MGAGAHDYCARVRARHHRRLSLVRFFEEPGGVTDGYPGFLLARRRRAFHGGFMARNLEELEAVVRERICRVCTERTIDNACGLEDPSTCALFRLFPEVARAVQSVQSDDIRDY